MTLYEFIFVSSSVPLLLTMAVYFLIKYKTMKICTRLEKIFLGFAVASAVFLGTWLLEVCDMLYFGEAFYCFLRWVYCIAFVCNVLNKQNTLITVASILGVILCNPFSRIFLAGKYSLFVFSFFSVAFLFVSSILIVRRLEKRAATTDVAKEA